jgi:16S rRNA G966 N2-methylase RsmD
MTDDFNRDLYDEDTPCPYGPAMQKVWNARYYLMRQFDRAHIGAKSLHSLTPEWVADRIASAIPGKSVLEICSGVGGMSIAFARAGKQVTSVELDPECFRNAKHNAKIYKQAQNINFVNADAAEYVARPDVQRSHFDVLTFDPPWGKGFHDYKKKAIITLEDFALGGMDLRDMARQVDCDYVAMKLPFNFDYDSLPEPIVRQNYGFLRTAEESGFWNYSMLVMRKDDFLKIPHRVADLAVTAYPGADA